MNIPFVDLKAQFETIKPEIEKAISDVLNESSFILGKHVEMFEQNFANLCNKKYAVAVNSGTTALMFALMAYGIKKGDEVITTPNTFIATAAAIHHTGAKPVFVDVDPEDYNMNPELLRKAITKKTKAIIPVHLYGQPANIGEIEKIAKEHSLIIIEDACQAHNSEYKNKKIPVTETGCFSFYPGKNLGAYGEGGMVVTDNEEVAKMAKLLRDHGQSKRYFHQIVGFNGRMEGIQGAVLNVKLKYLNKWTEQRRNNAKLYNSLLKGVVKIPTERDYAKHVYHLYIIQAKERDKLAEFLKAKGISTGLHYPSPLHLQQAFSYLNYQAGSFPVTESYTKEILSLPMYAELTREQIEYVCSSIKEFYESNKDLK
jgi:dTDP-4-amino-4,6-dideoxygalactose transaminase